MALFENASFKRQEEQTSATKRIKNGGLGGRFLCCCSFFGKNNHLDLGSLVSRDI